ncbi:MAG TPA: cytochrome P450 [Macromonas sp.]|nr:cytochrome P450 [Macromonas sp.]
MNAVLTPPRAPSALGRPLLDDAYRANPYPTYAELRAAGPLHWSDEFFGGAWLLTQHEDIDAVLKDPRFSAVRTGGWVTASQHERSEFTPFQQLFARALLFLDPPDHTRLRRLLNAGFRAEALQALAPRIEQIARELLDAVDHGQPFDFIQAVARPLPVRVISAMMDIPAEHHANLLLWSDDLADFLGAAEPSHDQTRRAQVSTLAMGRLFEQLATQRRQTPGDDLISRLVEGEANGDIQSQAEMLAQCVMLLFAGHETTRNALGNGLLALLQHPDQWQLLREEPEFLPSAVRELLRFDSPVQYTGRRVVTELELHGQRLKRGDSVVALIGAANRDPSRYEDPDTLDITRREGSSLTFGSGPHVCIGAALTRLETETVLRELMRRWDRLAWLDAQPHWLGSPLYRSLTQLTVLPVAHP